MVPSILKVKEPSGIQRSQAEVIIIIKESLFHRQRYQLIEPVFLLYSNLYCANKQFLYSTRPSIGGNPIGTVVGRPIWIFSECAGATRDLLGSEVSKRPWKD